MFNRMSAIFSVALLIPGATLASPQLAELARVEQALELVELTEVTSASGYTPNTPAAECGECHMEEYIQWSTGEGGDLLPVTTYNQTQMTASMHRLAYIDDEFHKHYVENGSPDVCLRCHVPGSVYTTDRTRGVYAPVSRSLNAPNATEGVTCVTCHLDQDGNIVGEEDIGLDVADHEVVGDPQMYDGSTLCASCHQDIVYGALNSTYNQWKNDGAPLGVSCVDCHMTDLRDFESETHAFPGAHSISMLEWGLDYDVPTTVGADETYSIEACNNSAMHNVPTGDQFRAYVFKLTVKGNGVNYSHENVVSPKFITPYMREIVDYDRFDPIPFEQCRNLPYEDLELNRGNYTVTFELGFWLLKPVTIKTFGQGGSKHNDGEVYTQLDLRNFTLVVN